MLYKSDGTKRIADNALVALTLMIAMIVHRDYFEEGAGILFEVYDDSVEITNPGRVLFDSSKFGKLGVVRNPILFDVFHRLGITEKIGSGIARMREAKKSFSKISAYEKRARDIEGIKQDATPSDKIRYILVSQRKFPQDV